MASFGQFQWSSYDVNGNLVTANAGTGGDLASQTSVTFTIPANTQMSFMTRSFTPVVVAGSLSKVVVIYNFSASAGLTGVLQRDMGWGLYNSAGTGSLADDNGYFGLWNGSAKDIETYDHPAGTATLFSGTKLGQGTSASGALSDGATYTNQIQLVMNAADTGISLGTSSSTLAAAGLAINGVNVTQRVYTNPVIPTLGGVTSFDEFGFMFDNTTANPITITLSGISLGTSYTWDASGANPAAPTDGAGNWSITNANWSSGASDNDWSPGYNAVIGANNGAAGKLTITDAGGEIVHNITFNAPGSGAYNITGSSLILTNTPTITVASGVIATNSSQLGGSGFVKTGAGLLVLQPSVAATNSGTTVVNAGTLQLGSSAVLDLDDSVTVTTGAVLLVSGSTSIPTASTLTINGGSVTNLSIGGTATETHNMIVFDNNGVLAFGPTGSGQIVATNMDCRSGAELFPKFASAQTTNFTVKSTSGTMIIQSRPNNTGVQGIILTLLAGTMIPDYPNPAPNGDSTQGGAKFLPTGPLTLGGGTLFCRFNANASRTENVLSTIILPGGTFFEVTNNAPNSSNAYGFTQNAIARSVGGTVDYSFGGTGGAHNVTTSTANVDGILGGWATFGESDWAIGTTIAAYTGYVTSTDPTTWVAANNISINVNPIGDVPASTTINTLKLSGSSALTLDGTFTLATGGLLVTGSGANSISGNTLEGASGADLIIQQFSTGDLTISSTLADNTSATALTKSGPGRLIITGTDSMTGNNYLNGGIVSVSSLAQLAGGSLFLNNGTLSYTGAGETSTRAVALDGIGGTFDIEGTATVTQTTPIVSGGGATRIINGVTVNLGDWSGLTKTGSGTLVLAANNVYNGPTVVNNGTLLVNGINSLTGTSGSTNYTGGGTFIVNGGTLGGTGVIPGSVDVKSGGTLAPGNSTGTLTLNSGLTLENGSTGLFQIANGGPNSLLAVQGNLVASNSVIAIDVNGSTLQPTTNTLITYTGTLSGSFNPSVSIVGGSVNASLAVDTSTPGQVNLDVFPQVVITMQPQDLTVSTNTPATFNVTATGSATLGYQWYYYGTSSNNTPTPVGVNSATFTIPNAQSSDSGLYAVVVSNAYNSVPSRFATLIVGNVAPVLNGPFNQTVIQGNNATFSASVVIANPQPTFQWQTNGVDVAGATGTSLTLNNVQFGLNGATVSIIASNAAAVVTNSATLTVIVTPAITPEPTNLTVNVGDTASFVSGATGVPAPTLQWYKNGVAIGGQTGSTLTIASAQGSDIGKYDIVAANTAGSVTSAVVTLTVNSTTLSAVSFAPGNGATGICYDTPLYITFNGPVSIVNSGSIRIYNVNNPTTPVDVINLSTNTVVVSPTINLTNNIQPHSLFFGDPQIINYFPVIITGNTAAIYPHLDVLTSNQTYYVTMDNGIVADGSGAYFGGISATNVWQFTTKAGGPVNPTNIVVATDNSGDFDTVQGAVDSVPGGNNNYTQVNIRNGNYVEIVDISGKSNITFVGQSRGAVVGYPNNNNLTGTTAARMAFKVNGNDIHLENLTITNGTPQGGSQAEALLVYNTAARCIVDNCTIVSRQDTVLINANTSQAYFNNCRIIGNFDYVWGVGVGYFNNCVFHTLTNSLSGSYNLTAARTATSGSLSATTPWVNPNGTTYSAYGFTFVDCIFEEDPGVINITLADSNGTPGGLDSWVNCLFDTNAYIGPSPSLTNQYVFWQYSNTNITGTIPISFTNVQTIGITNNDSRLLASTNVVTWFSGWQPQLAPYFITQPSSQTVNANQSASFVASAGGVPDPSYQWLFDGTNLNGQTSSTLTIPAASGLNIGDYSVMVSNSVTGIVSTNAALAVNPPTQPSTIAVPMVSGGNVQFVITGAPGSTGFGYRVWATTNIQLAPITSTWTLLTNGVFTGTDIVTDTPAGLPQRFYIITVP